MEKQAEKQLTIRMSPELHEQIRESAIKNKRSINAHAVWILDSYIVQEKKTEQSN